MRTKDAPCGTYAGYRRHLSWKEKACRPCLDANRAQKQRQMAQPTVRRKPPSVGDRTVFPVLPRADWMEQAACREVEAEWFFSDIPNEQARAIEVCRGCDVLAECLAYAVTSNSDGIWGGLLPSQLDHMKRRRRSA